MKHDPRWSENHTIAQEIRVPITRTVGLSMVQPHLRLTLRSNGVKLFLNCQHGGPGQAGQVTTKAQSPTAGKGRNNSCVDKSYIIVGKNISTNARTEKIREGYCATKAHAACNQKQDHFIRVSTRNLKSLQHMRNNSNWN